MKDRSAYFVSRYAEETAAADAATTDQARIAHLDLAMRYSLLAREHSRMEAAGESNTKASRTTMPAQ
jgi:hypothetical protein